MQPVATVDIRDAKTSLHRLIEQAAQGKQAIIAKAGKPLVKLTALAAPPHPHCLGFLKGQILVPEDFDTMGAEEIARLFGAEAG